MVIEWHKKFNQQAFEVRPDGLVWLGPSSLFALGLVSLPIELTYRLIFGNEYVIFIEAGKRNPRMISRGAAGFNGRPLGAFLSALGIILIVLLLDTYVRIDDDKLVINRFFDLNARQYQITEINEVAHYNSQRSANGKHMEKEFYGLYVNGTRIINTRQLAIEPDNRAFHLIVDQILSTNNLKMSEREMYE